MSKINNYNLNKLYVLDCPDVKEGNQINAKSLYDDTLKYCSNFEHFYKQINTKEDLFINLDAILDGAQRGENILIYLYMHGSTKKDGLIDNNGCLIEWKTLQEKLREINVKTHNGLYLTMASCYGSYIGFEVDLKRKAFFNAMISSQHKEKVMSIDTLFNSIFLELVYNPNIVLAYNKARSDEHRFYYKDVKSTYEEAMKSLESKLENKDFLMLQYEDYKSKVNQSDILPFEGYLKCLKGKTQLVNELIKKSFFFD